MVWAIALLMALLIGYIAAHESLPTEPLNPPRLAVVLGRSV